MTLNLSRVASHQISGLGHSRSFVNDMGNYVNRKMTAVGAEGTRFSIAPIKSLVSEPRSPVASQLPAKLPEEGGLQQRVGLWASIREGARSLFEDTVHAVMNVVGKTFFDLEVEGIENLPMTGAAMLVSNHVTTIDWLPISAAIDREISFVGYYKYVNFPIMKHAFRAMNAIPIAGRKENEEIFNASFDRIDDQFADERMVLIFPEGKLTRDGEMDIFRRTGVAKILDRRQVPVVPMAISGLWKGAYSHYNGQNPFTTWVKVWRHRFRPTVKIVIGEPVQGAHVTADFLQDRVAELYEPIAHLDDE